MYLIDQSTNNSLVQTIKAARNHTTKATTYLMKTKNLNNNYDWEKHNALD